ncbi:uncharacterized protein [Solanum tuberosum]|uniref:uncharacterized protein n=1 Tax=Solanum tuberosum TaxID=4113 RepID=UPI00073A0B40|nr:PREDICTED: uncharacterized protein LOC107062660 [Solanum tuberosum]
MTANGENSCQAGHPAGGAFYRDDIDDVNSVYNLARVGEMGAICMPQVDGNGMFEVTSATLQLIHSRGLFGGLEHEDQQEHIRSFVEVCTPLSFKNLSQESIRLRLFPLSLTGGATKWLVELPNNSIKSWEELVMAFHERFFAPSRMMKLRDDIKNFKQNEGEPIHESWTRLKRFLCKCPTYGLPGELLIQYFYRSLDSVNKGIADQLVQGGIMLQSFEVVSFLLDGMTRVNQAWYTKDDQVSSLCFRLTQEQLNKERERDENIKKMLSQMKVIQKHMNQGSSSGYLRPGENQGWNSTRYKEGFHPHYHQRGRNQGLNHYRSEEPRRYCHDWAEQNDNEEDHTQLSESQKSKGSASSPRVNDLLSRILDKVEGSDDLLKGMRNDFSSLNSKVNSHDDAIKTLEGQLRLLSAQLTSRTLMEDNERGLVVVTRRGKMEKMNVMEDEDLRVQEESQGIEERELPIPQNLAKEPQEDAEQHVQVPKVTHPLPKIPPPFPQRLKMKKEDEKFKKKLSVFKNLSIDLPLVEALSEMPGYAKFMKELVTRKRSLDYETIEVPHSCSAIMTNESITKREDPGAFIILCTIGKLQFAKALCDLGESINLMPYAIYKQVGLGEPKATTMRLLMADRSIKHPMGILYDILVKVDRFIFLADFVILDCEINAEIPIFLGGPFLATGRALVDVESGKLKFRVNDDEVTFNNCKSMKQPSNIHVVSTEDVIR